MATRRRKLKLALALMLDEDELWRSELKKKKKRTHRFWVRPWIGDEEKKESSTMFALQKELEVDDPMEFFSMVRMDPQTFRWLLGLVSPLIQRKTTHMRNATKAEVKLSLTLNYLAIGGSNASLSRQYRVGRSSAGKIIRETCNAIYSVLKDEYLTTPTDRLSWARMAKEFELRWQFPHCIGALDGKHVRVKAPNNSGSTYFNYHRTYSIVLMAVVSANYEFTFVDVGAEGYIADGGVWRQCALKVALDDGTVQIPGPEPLPGCDGGEAVPYVLVGDEAFPLGPGLLKPYAKRGLTRPQRIYNYRLSRARRLSENAFGILASRFRIFLTTIERPPNTVQAMVLASCAMHNMLRRHRPGHYMPQRSVDVEDNNFQVLGGSWRTGDVELLSLGATVFRNPTRYAKAVQEIFTDYFSNEGAVPWQANQIFDPEETEDQDERET